MSEGQVIQELIQLRNKIKEKFWTRRFVREPDGVFDLLAPHDLIDARIEELRAEECEAMMRR